LRFISQYLQHMLQYLHLAKMETGMYLLHGVVQACRALPMKLLFVLEIPLLLWLSLAYLVLQQLTDDLLWLLLTLPAVRLAEVVMWLQVVRLCLQRAL
jgi:hypothetical protein